MCNMNIQKIIENRIAKIKQELLAIGDMHPGSLSKQYNVCGKKNCRCRDPENPLKHGPYDQLSFVLKGKSSSRFIRAEYLPEIQMQVDQYKKFKTLISEWTETAAELAKLKYLEASKPKTQKAKQ